MNHTWKAKKILVAGLGGSGVSMIAYLREQGADVGAYDVALIPEKQQSLLNQFPNLPCFTGSLQTALAEGWDVLALSPGISERKPEIEAFKQSGGVVLGDVEILARIIQQRGDKVIAITGSNGKTTVTSLVGFLCERCGLDTVVAGNIGLPVLEAERQRGGKKADVWVLELSSFQLETTYSLQADAAVVLNISEDHLERYEHLLDYAAAKDKIFHGQGVQVLNADDPICRAMKRHNRTIKWFSLQQASDYWANTSTQQLQAGADGILSFTHIPLQGMHNIANVLAAIALCEAIGLPREQLCRWVQEFKGLPHRVEKVGEKNGVVFIDDSKGTNVGATEAAISGLNQPIILIAGGQAKGQDFTPLKHVLKNKAKAVLLIGVDAKKIEQDLAGSVPCEHFATLQEATQRAYNIAQAGDIVLLSPACASLDMFRSYAHRAEVFIETFHGL